MAGAVMEGGSQVEEVREVVAQEKGGKETVPPAEEEMERAMEEERVMVVTVAHRLVPSVVKQVEAVMVEEQKVAAELVAVVMEVEALAVAGLEGAVMAGVVTEVAVGRKVMLEAWLAPQPGSMVAVMEVAAMAVVGMEGAQAELAAMEEVGPVVVGMEGAGQVGGLLEGAMGISKVPTVCCRALLAARKAKGPSVVGAGVGAGLVVAGMAAVAWAEEAMEEAAQEAAWLVANRD